MKRVVTFMVVLFIAVMLLAGCTATESPNFSPTPAPGLAAPEPASEPGPAPGSLPAPDATALEPAPEPGAVPSPAQAPSPTPGMGTIEVYVTDPPPPEMDEIWVVIKNLSAHKSGSSWTTLAEAPDEFDLKAIEGIEQYLAGQIVETGKYTQIRLEVDSVRIVVGEEEHGAKVPSGEIKLVGNFEVVENSTTAITLDFNGEKSVNVTGNGNYIFKPVIKLLVEHPSSPSTPAPTVTSVDPDSGTQGETLDITIVGTNLDGTTAVSFGDNITVNSYTVDSDIQVTANITIAVGAVIGARDVSVTTANGTGTLPGGFTVIAPLPTVSSVSPSEGIQGQTLDITIAGTNLDGTTAVSFGDNITVNSYTVDSDIQVTANITIAVGAVTGARDVSVTTANGTGTLPGGFAIKEP